MTIRGVSFDAHGTLIHSPRLASIYREVLSRHAIEIEEDDLRALAQVVWQELSCSAEPSRDRFSDHPRGAIGFWTHYLERICALADAPKPSPFAAAELFDRFGHAEAWEIYPDVIPCLERLASDDLVLMVLSNFDQRLGPLLRELGLGDFFSQVVTSSDIGVEKPHPAIFSTAADLCGLAEEEILHVGDRTTEDLEGALAVGMHAVLIERSRATDAPGEDRIGSLVELPSRLVSAVTSASSTP